MVRKFYRGVFKVDSSGYVPATIHNGKSHLLELPEICNCFILLIRHYYPFLRMFIVRP